MKLFIQKRLLHLKHTMLFILFGIIIGYLSFLSATVITGMRIFDDFKNGVRILLSSEKYEDDLLYDSFVVNPDKGKKLFEKLETFLPVHERKNVGFDLFMKDKTDKQWTNLFSSGNHSSLQEKLQDNRYIQILEDTLLEETKTESCFFMGNDNERKIFVDLTTENDINSYIIQLTLHQESLFNRVKENRHTVYLYGIILLVISSVIGFIFAGRLSKPINKMTETAQKMAEGDMDARINSRRLDNLGILSRSLDNMAFNINHRMNTMNTMNRIDKAVLSSVSREELLYNVAGFITDQFKKSEVIIIEQAKEGYQVMASSPFIQNTHNMIVPYSEVPKDFMENAQQPFVLCNKSKFKISGFSSSERKVFNIPIFQDENYTGNFLIMLDNLSEQDKEALIMLTDQAGVALKSLHGMKKRESLYSATLMSLTKSVDAKSKWTAGHSGRVMNAAEMLLERLNIDRKLKKGILTGAQIHDIGKIGIPEAILDKPGKLTDAEFERIKSHPEKGYEIIKDLPDFDIVKDIVKHHHEKWDGTGYPDRLKGDEIPLAARIITIADVYDAITDDRPYRKGFTFEETLTFLKDQRGRLFDPELLDIFIPVVEETCKIPVEI